MFITKRVLAVFIFSVFTSLQCVFPRGTEEFNHQKIPWDEFKYFDGTMTEEEFTNRIQTLYARDGILDPYMNISQTSVKIFQDPSQSKLLTEIYFSENPREINTSAETLQRKKYASTHNALPLQGLKILIDPGHIGGEFAVMEERIFRVGDRFIREGDMNLKVAAILKKKLELKGARVYLTKDHLKPASKLRPEDFFNREHQWISSPSQHSDWDPQLSTSLALKEAERLFYRKAEIQARARYAEKINPHFTICIHFNAVPHQTGKIWTERNEIVIFTHGSFEPSEITDEAQRYFLFKRLFERVHDVELPLAECIADAMAKNMKLPSVQYRPSTQYIKDGENPYIYARNFLANRIYPGPVVYLEPYYQNNATVFERALLGDYDGVRKIVTKEYPSIYREYADSVLEGILSYIHKIQEEK